MSHNFDQKNKIFYVSCKTNREEETVKNPWIEVGDDYLIDIVRSKASSTGNGVDNRPSRRYTEDLIRFHPSSSGPANFPRDIRG